MTEGVPNLKPHGLLSWLPVIIAVLGPLLTLVWMASRYPERSEFNEFGLRLSRVEIEVAKQSVSGESTRAASERTEASVRRLEDKWQEAAVGRRSH